MHEAHLLTCSGDAKRRPAEEGESQTVATGKEDSARQEKTDGDRSLPAAAASTAALEELADKMESGQISGKKTVHPDSKDIGNSSLAESRSKSPEQNKQGKNVKEDDEGKPQLSNATALVSRERSEKPSIRMLTAVFKEDPGTILHISFYKLHDQHFLGLLFIFVHYERALQEPSIQNGRGRMYVRLPISLIITIFGF